MNQKSCCTFKGIEKKFSRIFENEWPKSERYVTILVYLRRGMGGGGGSRIVKNLESQLCDILKHFTREFSLIQSLTATQGDSYHD